MATTADTAERFAREYEKCADIVRTGEPWERERARLRRAAILRAVREAQVTREFNCYLTGDAGREPGAAEVGCATCPNCGRFHAIRDFEQCAEECPREVNNSSESSMFAAQITALRMLSERGDAFQEPE